MRESVRYVRLRADAEFVQFVRRDERVRNKDLRIVRKEYRFRESREIPVFRRNLGLVYHGYIVEIERSHRFKVYREHRVDTLIEAVGRTLGREVEKSGDVDAASR